MKLWRAIGRRPRFAACNNKVPLADSRFVSAKEAKWHAVDLDRALDDIWDSVHSSSRRAIRKARKRGVEIHLAKTKSDLRTFYELHGAVRNRKYRMLAQPYSFFEAIWDGFLERGNGFLLLARYEGRTIAGVLYLRHGDTVYYKFNASAHEQLAERPNDLLLWEGLTHAKQELGCRKLDLGLSDTDQDGLIRYKRKFATEEKMIRFLQHLPATWMQRSNEQEWSKILPELTGNPNGRRRPASRVRASKQPPLPIVCLSFEWGA